MNKKYTIEFDQDTYEILDQMRKNYNDKNNKDMNMSDYVSQKIVNLIIQNKSMEQRIANYKK